MDPGLNRVSSEDKPREKRKINPHLFWGSVVESFCYWLYLAYVGPKLRGWLAAPWSPVVTWDPSLLIFVSVWLVDYAWRKCLAFGNAIDPALGIIYAARGDISRAWYEGVPIGIGSLLGCVIAYGVADVVHPVTYAKWQVKERGLVFCFLCELIFSTFHQMRNAFWISCEQELLRQRSTTERIIVSGHTATASLITAALVTLSSPFTEGGCMLHAGYTLMASLATSDFLMLSVLGSANVLAAYIAGRHATVRATKIN